MTSVLLLEDSDNLADSVARALEASGHSVTRFRNVREASRAIPPVGFRVLLCDYDLPDGTGLDFLAAHWTTIIWSGLDRAADVAASGLAIDHVRLKNDVGGLLELIGAA